MWWRLPITEQQMTLPAFQIKNFFIIQLANSGAMCAFDIIRKNFQLRLAVHRSFFGENQATILLKSICFLSILPDQNLAVKDSPPLVVDDAFV